MTTSTRRSYDIQFRRRCRWLSLLALPSNDVLLFSLTTTTTTTTIMMMMMMMTNAYSRKCRTTSQSVRRPIRRPTTAASPLRRRLRRRSLRNSRRTARDMVAKIVLKLCDFFLQFRFFNGIQNVWKLLRCTRRPLLVVLSHNDRRRQLLQYITGIMQHVRQFDASQTTKPLRCVCLQEPLRVAMIDTAAKHVDVHHHVVRLQFNRNNGNQITTQRHTNTRY
jgi:hypothetical protein